MEHMAARVISAPAVEKGCGLTNPVLYNGMLKMAGDMALLESAEMKRLSKNSGLE